MTSPQLSDQSMYSRGQVLTRDFMSNTLRSLIVQTTYSSSIMTGVNYDDHSHLPVKTRRNTYCVSAVSRPDHSHFPLIAW